MLKLLSSLDVIIGKAKNKRDRIVIVKLKKELVLIIKKLVIIWRENLNMRYIILEVRNNLVFLCIVIA